MSKSYFFFFIFFSFLGNEIKSQEQIPLQFKMGNVFTENQTNDFDNPLQLLKIQAANQYFFLIQFETPPNDLQKQQLSLAYGLVFSHYLPANAFYCYAAKPLPAMDFPLYHIHSVTAVESLNKIDNSLIINIPSYIKMSGGKLNITVSVYDESNLEDYMRRLTALGYEVRKINSFKKIIHLTIEEKKLNALAALPFIMWMEAEQDAPFSFNLPALTSHRDNVMNYSGLGGRNLNGDSVVIGEGDVGYIAPHMDQSPRMSNFFLIQSVDHAEHVAGTIMGAGNIDPSTKGMASKATILADYFNSIQDDVPLFYPTYNMVFTSNSWGSTSGCGSIGEYNASSASIDQQLRDYPKVLHVFAASNDGGNNCSPYTSGYRTIGSNENCAKNVLTVGALSIGDVIAGFSSRGPCLDGRIKPEVCAIGVNVYSSIRTNTYGNKSGTSMATPGVTGSLALLEQRYRQLHSSVNADAALLKALLANTADDLGNAGPDYYYGFGRINSRKAVECMEANKFREGSASQNDSVSYVIAIPAGVAQLKVMLYWSDKEGVASASYSLVNNLDLKVYDPSATLFKPWVLDFSTANCANAATRKTDTLNNIEQVTITNPSAGNYTLVIRATSVPFGPQDFKLVYDFYSPAIKLTYPLGNEKLVSGTAETIYWDNTGINSGTFTLSYSTDSGISYTNIVTGLSSSTSSYIWNPLPTVNSKNCMVKIAHSSGSYTDSSASIFTIGGKPGSFTLSACDKQARLSWATVTSAIAYQVYLIDSNLSGNIIAVKQVSGTSCSICPLTNGKDYWFSVAAVFSGGFIGQRAIALKATPSATACNDAGDIGITAVIAPVSGRMNTSTQLSATQNITITIKNFSGSGISSIPVNYSLNGGSVISETYAGTIAANSTYDFTFSTTANFSATGNYTLKCFTSYISDPNASNDTLTLIIKHIVNNPVTLPFLENMEGCTQNSLSANYTGIDGMEAADYSNSTVLGRSRFALGTGYVSSGTKSVVFDKSLPGAATNTNYLTYTLNLSNYTSASYSPTMTFNFTHYGEESNAADSVWMRGNDTLPFVPVYSLFQNKPAVGIFKTSALLNIKNLLAAAGQSISSSFQMRFGQQDDSSAFSTINTDGFAFDDINVFDLNNDISMDSVINLGSACSLSSSSKIIFRITNNSSSIQTNIPVAYRINGGSMVRDTVPLIAANSSITDTFSTNADFSATGVYIIKAWTEWPIDQYHNNDTFTLGSFTNYGLVNSFPYKQNFESSNGNWTSGIINGSRNSWAWGSPTKSAINGAGNGVKCWVTNLTSFYPSNEESYLVSPCMDFSALSNPKISFLINFVTESTWDCVVLERSIDGGNSWQRVDSNNNTKLFNAIFMQSGSPMAPVWSSTSNGWSLFQFPLNGMNAQSNCKIRFRFFSDGGVVDEGAAVDSIVIYDKLPVRTNITDYSVTTNKPIFKGSEWIDVADNSDSLIFSINPNGNNLGSTSWGVRVNNGPIRTDSCSIGGSSFFGYYLDRNFYIHPQTQPITPVDIRFYVKNAEIQAIKDSVFNKYGRIIPNDSIDISKEATTSTNLDPTNHTGSTGFVLLNSTAVVYNSDLYLQVSTPSFSKFNPSFVPENPSLALPVKWLKVSAAWENSKAKINWKLAQEINVDHYEIEYSWDGLHFGKAGEAASIHNSYISQNYFFYHQWNTENQVCYYRIKEVDYDGRSSYSVIISLTRNSSSAIYPIPANDKINVNIALNNSLSAMGVECYDMEGRKYFTMELQPKQIQFTLDISALPNGIYLLRFNDGIVSPIRFEVLH